MTTPRASADIRLDGVSKTFDGRVRAVDDVSLAIEPGEFFSLLGPSGCGKTTTLRIIAGFEAPDSGRIHVGGTDITDVPVHRRDMGMVFQSYALFPHRTVAENVAFGLRMRGVHRNVISARVYEALEQVALVGYEQRRPAQLSGGQQQRVALARAIVIRPSVLLCDEPLGALDRKLRQSMQFELKQLQKELGVTLVFVTHDQEEALAMSDRIAVMNAGRLEQVGAPTEIYDRPRTRFVADFIGEINLFEGSWQGGRFTMRDGRVLPAAADGARSGAGAVAVRPEKARIVAPADAAIAGRIESANFLGGQVLYRIAAAGDRHLLAKETNVGAAVRPIGAEVGLSWNAADAVVLED
ncbi:MAG: ABC transporter ATP-binding protein [Alphaproteobacteria bacterium]|nr:ABC transporter ATP-binding protein [Alphaproteobacteria bacterium]